MEDPLAQLRLRFADLGLRRETAIGAVYAGRSFQEDVRVVVLSSAAASDPAVRAAFADAVTALRRWDGDGPPAVLNSDLTAGRPWVALRTASGRSRADDLLRELSEPTTATPTVDPVGPAVPAGISAVPPAPAPDSAPATPYPLLSEPPEPHRRPAGSVRWPPIVAVAAVVAAGLIWAMLDANPVTGEAEPAPPAGWPPQEATAPLAEASKAASPTPTLDEPEWRDIEPVSVVGPTFEPDDETYEMTPPGWPFAFRIPSSWECLSGTFEAFPDALLWHCRNDTPDARQWVNVMLWQCPTTCTVAEQEDMVQDWLDEPGRAVRVGSTTTVYVETEENDRGNYTVDLSHFTGDPADPNGTLQWHVGIYLESPAAVRDSALKVLNDVIGQAS